MNFLLDTNIVSEWVKARPNPGVVGWLAAADEDRVFISVITLAELRHGVERMAGGRRRRRIEEWLQYELPLRFEGRILPIEILAAEQWGKIVARSETAGRPIGVMDGLIAATAEVHRLTLVTRNVSDFQAVLSGVVNPWVET